MSSFVKVKFAIIYELTKFLGVLGIKVKIFRGIDLKMQVWFSVSFLRLFIYFQPGDHRIEDIIIREDAYGDDTFVVEPRIVQQQSDQEEQTYAPEVIANPYLYEITKAQQPDYA
jgi:hypothetical protein